MSMGWNYNVESEPEQVSAEVRPQLTAQDHQVDVQLVVERINPFVLRVTPEPNDIEQDILTVVAWPLAQSIGVVLPPVAAGLVAGRVIELFTLPMHPQRVVDVEVTAILDNPKVGHWNRMLMVETGFRIE